MNKLLEVQAVLIQEAINRQSKLINNEIDDIIMKHSQPPIKGELTGGKLKWRGIQLKITPSPNIVGPYYYQVFQREKQIGKTIVVDCQLNKGIEL